MMILPSLIGFGGAPESVPYVGPLDGRTDIQYAYSVVRLQNTAYAGSALKIRRSSDNAEIDIGFLASGLVDTASAVSFCGAGSGYCVKVYNQSGNGKDLVQTTASKQPMFVSSGSLVTGLNGKPSLRFDEAAFQCLNSPANTFEDPPSMTIFAVAGKRANADYGSFFQFGFFQLVDFYYHPGAVRFAWELYDQSGGYTAGELYTSINTSAIWFRNRVDHVAKTYTAKYKAFSTTANRTGTFTGTRSASSHAFALGCRNGAYYLAMDFHELIILNTDAGSTDFATLETNIETLYSI